MSFYLDAKLPSHVEQVVEVVRVDSRSQETIPVH